MQRILGLVLTGDILPGDSCAAPWYHLVQNHLYQLGVHTLDTLTRPLQSLSLTVFLGAGDRGDGVD